MPEKLTPSQQPYTQDKTFKDEDLLNVTAVALVDEVGDQTGTLGAPLQTQDGQAVNAMILTELRIMNRHLARITGENIYEDEIDHD